jgi:dTDP-glucose pyrophosphorylase
MTKEWKNTLISPEASVRDCIEVIDQGGLQIALVVAVDGVLMGTVTDGDIRRSIIRGIPLEASVAGVMNTSPLTASVDVHEDALKALMLEHNVLQLPLLDGEGKVVGLKFPRELFASHQLRDNWVVLMAGGLGTRLRPYTDDMPKPLVPVGNKPLLKTIIEGFIAYGFHKFYISVNYKSEMIMNYFGNGDDLGVTIRYLEEDAPMGTIGCLRLLPSRPKLPFVVMNGDVLTRVNYGQLMQFHENHAGSGTMCVIEYDFQVPFGVVTIENEAISEIVEKPVHRYFVNAGIYVLDPSSLGEMPETGPFDMTSLFTSLANNAKHTAAFPIREYWLDVGHVDSLRQANHEFDEIFSK